MKTLMRSFQFRANRVGRIPTIIIWILAAIPGLSASATSVDADFPGGNIIVGRIEGDTINLRPNQREAKGDWSWWCFRVREARGRDLQLRFVQGDVIGVQGPALSLDGRESWQWLGKAAVTGEGEGYADTFHNSVPGDEGEVYFSVATPYPEEDLTEFLNRFSSNPSLQVKTLGPTRAGRKLESVYLGCLQDEPLHRLLLTCRHCACGSPASYVLEGLMEAILSDTETGTWYCNNVEVLVIPFMALDEAATDYRGETRLSHDHNRDFGSEAIHPSGPTLRGKISDWSDGKLRVAIGLQCPPIRGKHNEVIRFLGGRDAASWEQTGILSKLLKWVNKGSLSYDPADNLEFGKGANTEGKANFSNWAVSIPGIRIATILEVPCWDVNGVEDTKNAARVFGKELAEALRLYLSMQLPDQNVTLDRRKGYPRIY